MTTDQELGAAKNGIALLYIHWRDGKLSASEALRRLAAIQVRIDNAKELLNTHAGD